MNNMIKFFLLALLSATAFAEVCVENKTGLSESHFAFEFIRNPIIDRSQPGLPFVTSPKQFFYDSMDNLDVECVEYDPEVGDNIGYLAVFDNTDPVGENFWITKASFISFYDQTLLLTVKKQASGGIKITKSLNLGKSSPVPVEKVRGLPKD